MYLYMVCFERIYFGFTIKYILQNWTEINCTFFFFWKMTRGHMAPTSLLPQGHQTSKSGSCVSTENGRDKENKYTIYTYLRQMLARETPLRKLAARQSIRIWPMKPYYLGNGNCECNPNRFLI